MKKIITVATAAVLCVIIAAGTAGCVGSTVSYSNNKDALVPVIVEQPQDLTVRRGEETQGLEVKAYTDDNGTLSYRWYSNATDSTEGGTAVEEANSSVLDIDTAVSGTTYYYCVITNTNDFTTSSNKTASVTSEAAMVRIYAETETPRIEEQPIAANYVIGAQEEAVPLSVSAKVSAGELSYQWYESATGTFEDGVAISGAINATYTPSLSERGQKYYYCEITNTDESASEEKTVSVRSKMVCISLDYDYEGFEFEAVDETTCKLTKYTGSSLKPVIPNTDEEGRAVVAIGAGVFGELSITEVTIPETVTEFGTLSQLNSGYGIPEDGVFYKCTSLHYIHYTGQADIIGDSCFRSCSMLETNVWDFCKQVKKIGKSAFQEVGSFPEELVLPETLESIDKYAFQKVSNVKKIIFETENITGIYGATFESMPDLEEVTIPASVTTIIEGFKGCYALKSFTYLRSVGVDGDVTQSNPFAKTTVEQYPDLVIYVPEDSVEEYTAVLGSFAVKIAGQQA